MKRLWLTGMAACLVLVAGCGDRLLLEQTRMLLVLGLDTAVDDRLLVYTTYPVFTPEAKEKYNISADKAVSLRHSRQRLDAMSTGTIAAGKLQNVLISKRLLQKQNIFPDLDVLFRDPKNDINARMIVVDGPLKDVIYANMKDKGRIGIVIRDIVDSAHRNGSTVLVRLEQFHRQMLDDRITPSMTEIKAQNNELIVTGTALLKKNGLYATSLNRQESSLLLLLTREMAGPIPLTIRLPSAQTKAKKERSTVSFDIQDVQYDIKTGYEREQFVFEIGMKRDHYRTFICSGYGAERQSA
ncbi:hypothetical protein LOK74_23000 [Brevibacillus humidisoli]|uniref:Ger(x)C family spore germination protein n=1 Tax=Brevibacillus humidisoli TaxID=2895522 RepID=UPI001E62214D|nr:hypothetical protein [Brevibacillus humidisoli]UFJ40826.1 hypothetical protein LOK74_23000 [Brevibacillus humidisoli]